MTQDDLTRLIGTLSATGDRAPTRRERKRLRRLTDDLCLLASALREMEKMGTLRPAADPRSPHGSSYEPGAATPPAAQASLREFVRAAEKLRDVFEVDGLEDHAAEACREIIGLLARPPKLARS